MHRHLTVACLVLFPNNLSHAIINILPPLSIPLPPSLPASLLPLLLQDVSHAPLRLEPSLVASVEADSSLGCTGDEEVVLDDVAGGAEEEDDPEDLGGGGDAGGTGGRAEGRGELREGRKRERERERKREREKAGGRDRETEGGVARRGGG